ncbi:hypothetical protein CYMTET_26835 [Cymbomonas tetramitiformis]|uniref:Uncharacterized protein n=1 Tax=Cymbomonas tetramitiformis TaxID=36881 RepID=A0AAE0FRP2_9CHLO|nr:hypothetical protein CYMTET_26835 [Cymbomonas tetramitiformis]
MLKALELEVDSGQGIVSAGAASPWCIAAQRCLAGLSAPDEAKLVVSNVYTKEATSFEHTRVGFTARPGPNGDTQLFLNTSGHNKYNAEMSDTATSISAKEIGCKLLSSESIERQLNVTAVTRGVTCGDVNKYAAEMVMKLLSPTTLKRYKAKGRQLCWKPDFQPFGDVGPLFIYESLELTENATCLAVASLAMSTAVDSKRFPGVHYCKLLSPAKIIDWIMTDSLKPDSSTSQGMYSLAANQSQKGAAFNYFSAVLQKERTKKSMAEVNKMMKNERVLPGT